MTEAEKLTTAANLRYDPKEDKRIERGYSMIGAVRTKEKCPTCGGLFKDTGRDLICPKHGTRPRRYYAFFYHKGDHRKYGFKSYPDVVDYLRDVEKDIQENSFDPRNYRAHTLKEFQFTVCFDTWIKSREEDRRIGEIAPSSLRKMKEYRKRLVTFFGKSDVRSLKKENIKLFLRKLQEEGLSKKTQKNILSVLHKLLVDTYDNKEIKLTVPRFPTITINQPETNWIDNEMQKRLIETIPARHRPVFQFLMTYGCRPGEARALQHSDINYKLGLITIQRTFSERVLCDVTKTKKSRELPLFKDMAEMFRRLPRSLEQPFVFLFKGKPYNNNTLGDIWRAACKRIGLAGVCLYEGTRHSAASQLVNRGVPLQVVMELLGHSNIRMTLRYSHISAETLRKSIDSKVFYMPEKVEAVNNEKGQ